MCTSVHRENGTDIFLQHLRDLEVEFEVIIAASTVIPRMVDIMPSSIETITFGVTESRHGRVNSNNVELLHFFLDRIVEKSSQRTPRLRRLSCHGADYSIEKSCREDLAGAGIKLIQYDTELVAKHIQKWRETTGYNDPKRAGLRNSHFNQY
jgi:hypothetical protein